MSLSPGIVGNKTQLIDGVQVDAISELTTSNGVQIAGRTSGVAIGAGYVGETIAASSIGTISQGSPVLGQYYDMSNGSISLTPGIWTIYLGSGFDLYQVTVSNQAQPALASLALRKSSDSSVVKAFFSTSTFNVGTSSRLFTSLYGVWGVTISSTTSYKISGAFSAFTGTPTCGTLGVDTSYLYAIRIA
jgi:hypothetical protein